MTSGMAPPVRIAITGSSGLYGRTLIREIRRSLPHAVVLGVDREASTTDPPDHMWQGDILSGEVCDAVVRFAPDTLVHLAYAVQPGRDLAAMRRVNVEGTRAMLETARAVPVSRLLVASSATVYGAWPDNPPRCDETTPVRPLSDYYYSAHKGIVERLLREFTEAHPEMAVCWTRPAIICGPGVTNFLSEYFRSMPFLGLPDGRDTPLQFVHHDDVARATLAMLMAGATGPFNVAPDDALTHREIARILRVPAVPLPYAVMAFLGSLWWTLRLP